MYFLYFVGAALALVVVAGVYFHIFHPLDSLGKPTKKNAVPGNNDWSWKKFFSEWKERLPEKGAIFNETAVVVIVALVFANLFLVLLKPVWFGKVYDYLPDYTKWSFVCFFFCINISIIILAMGVHADIKRSKKDKSETGTSVGTISGSIIFGLVMICVLPTIAHNFGFFDWTVAKWRSPWSSSASAAPAAPDVIVVPLAPKEAEITWSQPFLPPHIPYDPRHPEKEEWLSVTAPVDSPSEMRSGLPPGVRNHEREYTFLWRETAPVIIFTDRYPLGLHAKPGTPLAIGNFQWFKVQADTKEGAVGPGVVTYRWVHDRVGMD